MIADTKATSAVLACLTVLVLLAPAGTAEARGERIINGPSNTRADFSLDGKHKRHTQRFEFAVEQAGDLHFLIACDDQSEMDVTLRADDLKDGASAADAPHHTVTSKKPVIFTFAATEAHVMTTRTWGLEVTSEWSMPVCTMALSHGGRVVMFRSADSPGDSISRASDTDETEDKWKDRPFVVFIAPMEGR